MDLGQGAGLCGWGGVAPWLWGFPEIRKGSVVSGFKGRKFTVGKAESAPMSAPGARSKERLPVCPLLSVNLSPPLCCFVSFFF